MSWDVHGFVLMPDHFHLLLRLNRGSLAQEMASFSKFTGRRINNLLGGAGSFWQEGYYEHAIRSEDDLRDILTYILQNPVRAGLVNVPEAWPYRFKSPE